MLHQTRGIILKTTRFKESSAIVNIYTEKLGLQTYIVNRIFSKKTRNKAAYLQPLSLLNLVVYYRENQNIKRIKEMQWAHIFTGIPFHPVKRVSVIFMNEILNKCIKEEEANLTKFQFLFDLIVWLDNTSDRLSNYLICFLLDFTTHLGFAPLNNKTSQKEHFNLKQGQFVEAHILNSHQVNTIDSQLLYQFLNLNNQQRLLYRFDKNQRKDLLQLFLQYYQIHIEGFGRVKSLTVLEKLF